MREDGERLVAEGITSPEEVMRVTGNDPQSLPLRLGDGHARLQVRGADAAGKSTTGLLEADNARAARAQLRAQALVPLEVTQVASAGTHGQGLRFTRRVFTTTGLTVWTRQLAGLVGSGLPLERALTALGDEAEDAAPARAGRAPAHRGQRRLAVRTRAGQRAARVRRGLPRRGRRRRTKRRARARCSNAWPTTSKSARRCGPS